MNVESVFKILFLLIFIPFILFWFRKFLKSGVKRESFYTIYEGFIWAFLFRFLQTSSFISIIIYIFAPQVLNWFKLSIPLYIRFSGFPVGLISLYFMFSAFRSIGKNYFASLNIKEGHKLITDGIYSWVRHPLYVIFCTIWICFFLLSSNLLIGITGVLSYIVIFIKRVPKEEQLLESVFNDEYRDYTQNTGKIFPRKQKLLSIFNSYKPLDNK